MADGIAKPAGGSPTLLLALLAMLCHGTAHPALPPATADDSVKKSTPTASTANESNEGEGISWFLPPIRFGGTLSYGLRRDSFEDQQRSQTGLTTTLNASTNTFIWQPWFAQLSGSLGFTTSSNSSSENEAAGSSSRSVAVTGNGQLSVLSQSKFPFEAHFQRNDNRAFSDLALANGGASQRYGFTQRYFRPEGDVMFGWDRSEQSNANIGLDVQDSLQLRMSHRLENHRLQLAGDRSINRHEITDELGKQDSLSLQHSYTPDPSISVESMGNVSRSDYRLLSGRNDTRLLQLSSNAFWRPEGQPMTVNGGVRMFALGTDSTSFAGLGNQTENRAFNANGNLGVNYEFNRFTRLNASANVNMTENRGVKTYNTNQSAGASYQPESIALGAFRYNWGTSASASNRTVGDSSERQLSLQFSHSLSRSIKLDGGSTISMDVSQGVSASAGSRVSDSESNATKQLNHNGSVSWDLSRQAGSALLRLSASDSRALDGNQEFFQLINFQASSNLPISGQSSWNGSLTIQAVRQGKTVNVNNTQPIKGFVTSSSGSISYQNQRFFGIRQLRFVSDLRLNSDGLLPVFGTGAEQELAAWDNRLSYSIGRTQLQASMQVSSSSTRKNSVDPVTGGEKVENMRKMNKSIMFSVTRSFGNF